MCPVCSAGGKNADSECEENIVNEPCLEADPVCSLTVSTESSFMKFRIRQCRSREDYNLTKDDCEQRGNCAMAMCDTSGCKAEFSASGILIDLSMLKKIINCSIFLHSVSANASFHLTLTWEDIVFVSDDKAEWRFGYYLNFG